VDPDSLNPDRIRIQHINLIRIWIQGFDDQKFEKIQLKILFSFFIKIAIYLSIGLRLQEKPSALKKRTSST
jgi:hypothetical protein